VTSTVEAGPESTPEQPVDRRLVLLLAFWLTERAVG
jgi:hypothetical protein